jgi:hypothetical protein
VHVNPGGEPERDDTGLPPVDIEVPDDARELDRDVQAYYREQRARRRQQRSRRFHLVLARDSMVVPLLICCLVFALVSGTLLTLFTATSIDQNLPGAHRTAGQLPPSKRPTSPALAPAVTAAPSLASTPVTVGRTRHALGSLRPAVLLVVAADCQLCTEAVRHLTAYATAVGATTYLLYTVSTEARARELLADIGPGLRPAADTTGSLDTSYGHAGLTAIMVTRAGSVSYENDLQGQADLEGVLRAGKL